MPRLTPIPSRLTGHNGALLPPRPGGGDDGNGDGDSTPNSIPNYGERLRQARLGLAVAMTPIFILFVSFTAVCVIHRGFLGLDVSRNSSGREWAPVQLPWSILAINTVILIVSDFAVDFARRDVTREAALAPLQSIPGISLGDERRFPWLAVTTVLGLLFLAGQLLVWNILSARGLHLVRGTSASFVYVLTAMHGLHFAGGLLALVYANATAWLHRSKVESRRIVVDITSWYWHCMTVVWLCIFVLFSFASQ